MVKVPSIRVLSCLDSWDSGSRIFDESILSELPKGHVQLSLASTNIIKLTLKTDSLWV